MPLPPAVGGRGMVFSGHPPAVRPSVRPSVRLSVLLTYFSWSFIQTCRKYSSYEWELLMRFSRSEVKGQGHMCTNVWIV